jgi:ubiquinone/menaquinone biosynthesis C-methylase UbiE
MLMTTPLWNLPTDHAMLAEHVALVGKRVVDVGAGAGGLVRFLREKGADPIGVECGPAMIAQALEADPEHHDAYVDGVGQDLPLDDASADLVVFSYSLHHVPDGHRLAALSEAERVLRSGGTLAVLEPIAEGPGHETHKLIDDETDVRAAAQAALDNDMPTTMTERDEVRYTTSYSYSDVAELEKHMVDIDPERQAAFDAVKDEVFELFHTNAVEHDGAYWFAQPVVMRLFTKV